MAAKVNLIIDQGTTFISQFSVYNEADEPVDFSAYTGAAQMRKSYTSSTSYSFDVIVSKTGLVTLGMSATNTALITAGRYLYDVEVTNNGIVSRIAEGIVTVTPQVTR
jgi:hypothetical protein